MRRENLIIIIGDIHGCINTLKKLFLKLKRSKTPVYSVGDLVDRGNHSKDVIEFCIKNNIMPVMGNHDYWMLDTIDNIQNTHLIDHWAIPFGYKTINSYFDIGEYNNSDFPIILSDFANEMKSLNHYNFIKSLPFKIEVNNVVITHSGIAEYATEEEDYLCNYEPCIKYKNKIQIFGHDHRKEIDYKEGWYANIDTSCVYGNKLTAVIVDTKNALIKDIIQENFTD